MSGPVFNSAEEMFAELDLGICKTCNGTGKLPGLNYAGQPIPCPDCVPLPTEQGH